MEIALIRHAQPQRWESDEPADPELTTKGVTQANLLAKHLSQPDAPVFQGLYSSTMTRAIETATVLENALGLTLNTVNNLVEYDHHLNFYLPTEDIEEDFETYWANLQQGNYVGHVIDLDAFQSRVVAAIDHIIESHQHNERIAIVCHGGVISAYLSSVVGNSQPLFFEPEYTSISRIHIYPGGRRHVLSANETPHLGFRGWDSALV